MHTLNKSHNRWLYGTFYETNQTRRFGIWFQNSKIRSQFSELIACLKPPFQITPESICCTEETFFFIKESISEFATKYTAG